MVVLWVRKLGFENGNQPPRIDACTQSDQVVVDEKDQKQRHIEKSRKEEEDFRKANVPEDIEGNLQIDESSSDSSSSSSSDGEDTGDEDQSTDDEAQDPNDVVNTSDTITEIRQLNDVRVKEKMKVSNTRILAGMAAKKSVTDRTNVTERIRNSIIEVI